MKKILFLGIRNNQEIKIEFSVNWFEYIILKRIFQKQQYKFLMMEFGLKGQKYDCLITDEVIKI